jgi:hypothetical protein
MTTRETILFRAETENDRASTRWLQRLEADHVSSLADAVWAEAKRLEDVHESGVSHRVEVLKEAATMLHALRRLRSLLVP